MHLHAALVFAIAVTSALQAHIGGDVSVRLRTSFVKNVATGPQTLLVVSKDFLALREDVRHSCAPVFVALDVIQSYEPLGRPRNPAHETLAAQFRGAVPTKWAPLFVNARYPFDLFDKHGFLTCQFCTSHAADASGMSIGLTGVTGKSGGTRLARPRYVHYSDIGAVLYHAPC